MDFVFAGILVQSLSLPSCSKHSKAVVQSLEFRKVVPIVPMSAQSDHAVPRETLAAATDGQHVATTVSEPPANSSVCDFASAWASLDGHANDTVSVGMPLQTPPPSPLDIEFDSFFDVPSRFDSVDAVRMKGLPNPLMFARRAADFRVGPFKKKGAATVMRRSPPKLRLSHARGIPRHSIDDPEPFSPYRASLDCKPTPFDVEHTNGDEA